jgi:hypothetical protein
VELYVIFGWIVEIGQMEDRDDEVLYVNAYGEEEEAFGGEALDPCQ